MPSMWMVRAGRSGENIEEFLRHGIIAFGDTRFGALSPVLKKDDLLRLYAEKYPEEKEGSRASWASQLMRLLGEMKTGDPMVTFDRDRRLYLLGTIKSEYEWAPHLIKDKPHIRRVQWTHQVPRDLLTVSARNSLGSSLTLFKIGGEVAKELQAKRIPFGETIAEAPPSPKLTAEEEAAEAEVRGLGLQEPRIFVEVKHRDQTKMGPERIRSFLGGRKPGDKCLYVSTGSFTTEARYEAERASVPTTLLNLKALRKLLVENYENLDAETRALVPLKRLYWPLG